MNGEKFIGDMIKDYKSIQRDRDRLALRVTELEAEVERWKIEAELLSELIGRPLSAKQNQLLR
jgi:cell division septum initiation protein DivIVA